MTRRHRPTRATPCPPPTPSCPTPSPGPPTRSRPSVGTERGLLIETSEGAQELFRRTETAPDELRREAGAVLRLPEGVVIDADDIDVEQSDDETMIINMGPQHPSTHGVLRLMMELDGETVLRTKPIIGYLHTGMEKTAEELTYVQGSTNVTRMDYLSPLHNELVLSLAVEALLGVEMPARADWIRMLLSELQRVSSHLMWMATNGMDHGSTSMMIYGFREREMILAFFEKTTGLRMNHNFIRPGGTAADLPDGWEDDVTVICDTVLPRLDEYDELLTGQPVFRERSEGIGTSRPRRRWPCRYRAHPALDRGALGPAPRDAVPGLRRGRLRRHRRHLRRQLRPLLDPPQRDPGVDPDPPPGPREDAGRRLPGPGQEGHPAARARIDESMEALIHHFKVFTEGFRVPEGEVYVAIESPRGELGCYLVSDGGPKPFRLHIRAPWFVNLQGLPVMMRGGLLADAVAIVSSVDPVMGEVDR